MYLYKFIYSDIIHRYCFMKREGGSFSENYAISFARWTKIVTAQLAMRSVKAELWETRVEHAGPVAISQFSHRTWLMCR